MFKYFNQTALNQYRRERFEETQQKWSHIQRDSGNSLAGRVTDKYGRPLQNRANVRRRQTRSGSFSAAA